MANTAYIVSSAGTTQLQDAGNGVDFTYTPMSTSISDEFVTETGRLRIRKTTTAAMGTVVANVARALNEAQLYNTYGGGTAPVYMYFQPNGYADAYRTEIITGNLALQDGNMDTTRVEGAGTKFFEFDLGFTRRNWFEGPETALTLSNPNGTSTSVYFDWYNDGGGTLATRKRYNYVDIAATSVVGDLLAPVIITINGVCTSVSVHNGWNADYTAQTRFEAEDSPLVGMGSIYGTAIAGGTCSNGTIVHTMQLSEHDVDFTKYQGNLYQVYGRILGNGTSGTGYPVEILTYIGIEKLYNFGGAATVRPTIYDLSALSVPWRIVDMGALYIPPVYAGTSYSALHLVMHVPDVNIKLDVLHVLPLDKRLTATVPSSVTYMTRMVIDTVTNIHYAHTTTYTAPISTAGDMALCPNKNQRLHFMDTVQMRESVPGTATHYVNVFYRPRRLTI
jgi:hypothetical protein